MHNIQLDTVDVPMITRSFTTVDLTDETIDTRLQKVLAAMHAHKLTELLIYCDLEHGSNFKYLTGFVTRFEEGLLLIHANGNVEYILGNENLKMVRHARISGPVHHYPIFSLPNQPGDHDNQSLMDIFSDCGLSKESHVGVVGWKLLSRWNVTPPLFDLPYSIITSLQLIVGESNIINATDIMISPENGVRTTNNANEVAHYEFGASLAAKTVQETIANLRINDSQLENSRALTKYALRSTVIPICASGERFKNANISPTSAPMMRGDAISITNGYTGGLSSRGALLVHSEDELNPLWHDYVEKVSKPYFNAIATWLENIRVGMLGGTMWQTINSVFSQHVYHWSLNPGHLTADEEWLSSPIYENSADPIRSGMMFQIDLIPSVPGYPGTGCEDTVLIADEQLKDQIALQYPELWSRLQQRCEYLKSTLGIHLSPDVLPMSDFVAFYAPYTLRNNQVLTVKD